MGHELIVQGERGVDGDKIDGGSRAHRGALRSHWLLLDTGCPPHRLFNGDCKRPVLQ